MNIINSRKMRNYILIVICFIDWVVLDEVYQNTAHVCEMCVCEDKDSFIMDCSKQNFQHSLANWPPHNKPLIATFSYNNITTLEVLPITEQKAKLVFDHCNIQYLDSGVFANIRNVEYIDLSYNLLTTEQMGRDDFKGPYDNKTYRPIAVKYLNLAYNQIHSLPRKLFEHMPDLEELNLEGNDFVVLDPNTQLALSTLSRLKILNLANNELTELEGSFVRKLTSLAELDLSSNHLDFVPLPLDYMNKSLRVLKLTNTYIFHLTDKSFLGLDLTELHLNNLERLKEVGANTFATQKNLKKLYLSGNLNLRGIDKEAFGQRQVLDELDLSNNSLSDVDFMLDWAKLQILKIDSNPLECTCSLYNITKQLSQSITRNLESPMCNDGGNRDISMKVYSLSEGICSENHQRHISSAIQHFNKIRLVLIILSVLLIVSTITAVAIAVVRYKKRNILRNYPFSAQVSYFPIQTQHI